jgi:hypothetical protein
MGLDLRGLCAEDEVVVVHAFLEAMDEANPAWMSFVRATGVGDHVEEMLAPSLVPSDKVLTMIDRRQRATPVGRKRVAPVPANQATTSMPSHSRPPNKAVAP